LRQLARQGKIDAIKLGRDWLTTEQSVLQYIQTQQRRHQKALAILQTAEKAFLAFAFMVMAVTATPKAHAQYLSVPSARPVTTVSATMHAMISGWQGLGSFYAEELSAVFRLSASSLAEQANQTHVALGAWQHFGSFYGQGLSAVFRTNESALAEQANQIKTALLWQRQETRAVLASVGQSLLGKTPEEYLADAPVKLLALAKHPIQPHGPDASPGGSATTSELTDVSPNQQPRVIGLTTSKAQQPSAPENTSASSGISQPQIQSLIAQTLQRYSASGAFTGPEGPEGQPGPSGSSIVQNGNGQTTAAVGGNPIVTYVPAVPANSFSGASLAGFSQLSAGSFSSGNTSVNGNLDVSGPVSATGPVTVSSLDSSGNATIDGTLSAATSTLSSLMVSGPVTLTGSTTITGLTVTGFNPGLTPGSIAFQGTSGLVQDNANFFYDSTDHFLGLGTTTPSQLLTVAGNGLFTGQLTVAGPTVLGATTIANLTLGAALPVSSGGTGLSNVPYGSLLMGSTTNTSLATIATGSQGTFLLMNNNVPSWTATSSLGIVSGIQSLNGQTGSVQTFATSTSGGLQLNITSASNIHTFTLQPASGYTVPLSASTTNWNNFYKSPDSFLTAGSNIVFSGTSTIAVSPNPSFTSLTVTATSSLGSASSTALTVSGPLFVSGQSTLGNASSTNLSVSGVTFITGSATFASLTAGNVRSTASGNLYIGGVNLGAGSSEVTGVLPVAAGGTGFSFLTANDILFGNGAGVATSSLFTFASGGLTVNATSTLATTTVIGDLAVNTNQLFVQTSTGNIGIGSSSPIATLSLQGTSGTNPLYIASSTGAGLLVIQQNGNVGIGTTSPGTALQVNGTITASNLALPMTTSATSGMISFGPYTFLHNYQAAPNSWNTFLGVAAGNTTFASTTVMTTGVGAYSLNALTTGTENSGFGHGTLQYTTTGSNNTVVGSGAMYSNVSGSGNSVLGIATLSGNLSGNYNVAIGYWTLQNSTSSSYNIAIGYQTMENSMGNNNIAIGTQSLFNNTSGGTDAAVGYQALDANTSGNNNNAFGNSALFSNITGNGNSAFGADALYQNTSGLYNTAVGYNAGGGTGLTGNSYDTFIGYGATSNFNGAQYSTAIGYNAQATASHQVVIGDTAITQTLLNGNVGIGTSSPAQKLNVYGNLLVATSSYPTLFVNTATGNSGHGTSTPQQTLVIQGSGTEDIFNVASSSGISDLYVASNGNVGIGTTSPQYLVQAGNSSVSGIVARFQNANGTCDVNPTTGTLACSSDERLKKNITPMGDDLSQIMALQPVYFSWNGEASGTPEHPGFIAQQVEQVMPEVVSTDPTTGLLSIGYSDLVPAMVSAVQQIQAEITTLQGGLNGNASSSDLTVYVPSNFSGDSVGEAEIPAGQTSVRVFFSQSYEYQPIVTADVLDVFIEHNINSVTSAGFTISIPAATTTDITFNWHSFASPSEKLAVSDGTTQSITMVVANTTPTTSADPLSVTPVTASPAPTTPAPAPQAVSPQVLGASTTTVPTISVPTSTSQDSLSSSAASATPNSNASTAATTSATAPLAPPLTSSPAPVASDAAPSAPAAAR